MLLTNDFFYSILNVTSCPKIYIRLSLTCKRIHYLAQNKDLTNKFLVKRKKYQGTSKYIFTINLLKNGQKEGLFEEWYKDGQLQARYYYINNKQEGVHERWYYNGQLCIRDNFVLGKRNGLCEVWYESGQLRRRFNCVDHKIEGLFEEWYSNGLLIRRINFVNGIEKRKMNCVVQ